MILDDIVLDVSNSMPKFNKNTLIDYDNKQLEDAIKFIDICFGLAIKLIGCNDLTYEGYRILTPEERVEYETTGKKSKKTKETKVIPLLLSNLQLVKFNFKHKVNTEHGVNLFEKTVYLYVPFLHQNMLMINGKRMSIVKSIVEKIFSKITLPIKNKKSTKFIDGVMIRPIRARLSFMRYTQHKITTVGERNRTILREYVIGAKLHLKSHNKRKVQTTILHYLLCKFGLTKTLDKFGLTYNDLNVSTKNLSKTNDDYRSFSIYDNKSDIYINVKENYLTEKLCRKIIVNLHYLLSNFHKYTIEDLYDDSCYIYRVFLGMIIYPNDHIAKAKADIDVHIDSSVDHFIDPIMNKKLEIFNIPTNDIYELMTYIFINIDRLVFNCSTNNLFEKRLDITDGILVKSYAEKIFYSLYDNRQRSSLKPKEVDSILRIYPMAISNAYNPSVGGSGISKKDGTLKNINRNPQIYGDNWLLSCGCSKIRQQGTVVQKFDPSIPVVESIHWFVGKVVGVVGGINPFVEINSEGVFKRPDYADEVLPMYDEDYI